MITRRDSLRMGAAALAAPMVVPGAALGAGGRTPPSDRITMGFIGVGHQNGMGTAHLVGSLRGAWFAGGAGGFLGREDTQVLAVCDVNRVSRETAKGMVEAHYAAKPAARTYRGCGCFTDFRDLLARPDIDAVVVATPPHWHGVMVAMACKAGKDVYSEKPLGLTIREGRAVVEAGRRYGRVIQVGTQYAVSFAFRRAGELALSGRLGKLQYACIHFGFSESPMPKPVPDYPVDPVPDYLDWDLYVGPNPWQPYSAKHSGWRSNGGMLWDSDMSIHCSPAAQRGLGMDGAGPVEITRDGVRYAKGLELRAGAAPYWVKFVGDAGWAAATDPTSGHARVVTDPPHLAREPLGPDDVRLYGDDDHHGNFLDCIRTRRRCTADAENHHRAMSLHLIRGIAKATGATRWDPEQEVFVGENADRANRYLSRPYREPWRI
jgi:predicted dehydrogenase